jgi:hypothetical protein
LQIGVSYDSPLPRPFCTPGGEQEMIRYNLAVTLGLRKGWLRVAYYLSPIKSVLTACFSL